jgi:hypothetical protein
MTDGVAGEAEERYLAEIRRDCAAWLGAGADLLDLRREPTAGGVRLAARIRFGHQEFESAGVGESILAAHSALRAQILLDRVRFGFSAIVQPRDR